MHVITHLTRNRNAINCLPTNLCTVKFENAENIHKKNQSLEIWVLVSYDSQKYVKKHWWVIIWWVTIDYTIPDLIDLFNNDCKVVRK